MNLKTAVVVGTGALVIGGAALFHFLSLRSLRAENAGLRDVLATVEGTVKLREGVWERRAVEVVDLRRLLDASKGETLALAEELRKSHRDVVAVTKVAVRWKNAYEGAVAAGQTTVLPASPDDPPRIRVDFSRDFGPILVTGHTITDPPEGHVKVEQTRPLHLTLALSRAKDGSWRTMVAADDGYEVDVELAGVDFGIFTDPWYRRLGVGVFAGVSPSGGAHGSIGLLYKGDRFVVGPTIGVSTESSALVIGGAFQWFPFVGGRP